MVLGQLWYGGNFHRRPGNDTALLDFFRRAVTSVAAPFRHVLESAVAGASAGPAASIAALNGALAVVGPHAR